MEWNHPFPQTSTQACVGPTPGSEIGGGGEGTEIGGGGGGAHLCFSNPFQQGKEPSLRGVSWGAPLPYQAPRTEKRQLSGAPAPGVGKAKQELCLPLLSPLSPHSSPV